MMQYLVLQRLQCQQLGCLYESGGEDGEVQLLPGITRRLLRLLLLWEPAFDCQQRRRVPGHPAAAAPAAPTAPALRPCPAPASPRPPP
jgi:hypothetical protein